MSGVSGMASATSWVQTECNVEKSLKTSIESGVRKYWVLRKFEDITVLLITSEATPV